MLYDRTYMRDPSPPSSRPMVFWLIGTLVAAFVLQQIPAIWFNSSIARDFGTLSSHGIKSGFVWTLLTYGLLHGNLFHLLGNCLMLFFLGRQLESDIGSKRLLHLALYGTLGGAIGWLAVNILREDASMLGASAAAMSMLTVFACMHPRQNITLLLFFIIPVTLQPIWLLWIFGGIDVLGLLFSEIPGGRYATEIAHSAHLGGIAAGWLYYKLVVSRGSERPLWGQTQEVEAPGWFKKAKSTGLTKARYKVDVQTTDDLRAEVDRILDKINSEGFGALTPDEKARLDEARDLLSRR